MGIEEMKLIEEQIAAKHVRLKEVYKEIIETYRLLCKVKDEIRLTAVQGRADRGREESLKIRAEIAELQRQYFAEWDKTKHQKKDSEGPVSE